MRATRTISALSPIIAASLVLCAAGCGGGANGSSESQATSPATAASAATVAPTAPTTSGGTGSTYLSRTFVVPFEATVPAWLPPAPGVEIPNFVTWETTSGKDVAVRFMVPVSVYQPGATTSTPPPPDYLAYLLSQRAHGARFSDQRTTTVGGWPATIVTANTAKGLDGSIGCQTKGLTAGDCFGLQPDLTLRIAVIDADGRTLLAWLRHGKTGDPGDAKTEFASFEQMLSSIRFRGGKPQASTEAAPAVATPIDGVWSTTFTKRELVSSPLLMDQGEVNDGNWGHWTFTFKQGRFTFTQKNQRTASSTKGTFKVVGDTVDLSLENAEHFVMRWSIAGDKLTFKRDESIGVGPTPFVISSWKRER